MPEAPAPLVPPDNVILRRLRDDAADRTRNGFLPIAGGVGITLAMALLGGLLVHGVLRLAVGTSVLGFWGWTILLALALAGIVVMRLRTPLRSGPINYLAVGADLPQMHRDIRRYTPGVPAELIADIPAIDKLLIGPRLLIAGIRQNMGADAAHRQRFFERCAHMLHKLASVGESVSAQWLLVDKHEPIAVLEQVLEYLERHDWVGANSTHSKVWLSSQAKQILPFMGVPVGRPTEV